MDVGILTWFVTRQLTTPDLYGFSIDGLEPKRSIRPVAKHMPRFKGPLCLRETNDVTTEIITSTSERESNYVHHGWSSTTIYPTPWTSSRIANTNQPNRDGIWTTKRTIAHKLELTISIEELQPVQEFEDEVRAALSLSTTFEKFQAVYRLLQVW